MPRNAVIEEKLAVLPHSPGVYLMKNREGSIIYVGKSKNLKNRVSSYFQSPENLTVKTNKLVSNITDFDFIVTPTEAEALLLENELIKRHTPRYNIKLKDSRYYPYIKITNEPYPHLLIGHTRRDDKCRYFGPYPSSVVARDIIKTVQKTFRLPNCTKKLAYGKEVCRPCLNYHIGQCIAPCTGKITPEEYGAYFEEVSLFLKGDYSAVEKSLTDKMLTASADMRFEAAAKYRDSIKNLKALETKQKIKSAPDKQQDIFGFYEDETHAAVAVLLVRDGIVIDKNVIHLASDEICDTEALCDLVLRFYHDPDGIPKEILLSFSVDEETEQTLSSHLSERAGHSVTVRSPQKGKAKELCRMADDNAAEAIRVKRAGEEHADAILVKLAQTLALEVIPERIESYDISNSADTDIYCGMIVVENGKFKRSDYRSFAIRTTDGADDYGSMREALSRRFAHILDDNDASSLHIAPDLILLDGGIGQVSTVKAVAEEMGISIPVFGMVKDAFHKTRTVTDGENEIGIAKDSALFSFVYKIQEEVHRFTFSKMDASRRKKMKTLSLTNVKGLGEAKAKALYASFPSTEALKNASVEELASVKGVTTDLAVRIHDFLSKTDKE